MVKKRGGLWGHLKCSLNGSGSAVLGQQAGVDVECAKARDGQELRREDVPVGCCDAQIRIDGSQLLEEGFLCRQKHCYQGPL